MITAGQKSSFINQIDAFPINQTNATLALELLNGLIKSYLNNQNPDIGTVYAAFVNKLVGTPLETPIKNYITMMTSLTSFGVGISDANKRQILNNAVSFLMAGLIVWISKK